MSTPIPGSTHVPGDFNGDGTSDILWYNGSLSQVGYWTMTATTIGVPATGGGITRTGLRSYNVTPGYQVNAVGDFNGDGYADLVFTSANNDIWLWTNDQHGGFTSTEVGTYPPGWVLVGAGDIDGDGYDDLLWMNQGTCQFAYWTMRGAVRTGYKTINIACDYYPIAIGYFTPTNRLSILWTSPANDLYIWDSTATGFKSYNLTSYVNGEGLNFAFSWAIGGGYEGRGIGIETYALSSDGVTYDAGQGFLYSRTFDAQGNQTAVTKVQSWSGDLGNNATSSGGYVIEGNGVNATGLYLFSSAGPTISTYGLATSNAQSSGNAPYPIPTAGSGDTWSIPRGWFVVGAPPALCLSPCLRP